MSDFQRRPKQNTCYQMKLGQYASDQRHCCQFRTETSQRYNDENFLEQMEKETEEQLEMAKQTLRNTESGMQQNQRGCHERNGTARRPSKACPGAGMHCKPNSLSGKEAIKMLSKVPGKNWSSKSKGKRITTVERFSPSCAEIMGLDEGNKLPKKPDLTTEELDQLIDQETKDVESAWVLTSEAKETYKKPCPKQQKAREAVRAILEPKKEEPLPCFPLILKETTPLIEPDPDDISPEVAANMMYTQERGIKMISCPEETIKHLFPQQFGVDDAEKPSEMSKYEDALEENEGVEGTEGVDDSVFTRTMSQQKEAGEDGAAGQSETGKPLSRKEVVLQEKSSDYVNRVQLRGNFAPWFPGYFVAVPDQGGKGGVQLAKSPSGIFQKAWMAAKPQNVPQSEIYLVE